MASTTFPFQSRKNLNSVSPINAIFTNDISLAHLLVTDIPYGIQHRGGRDGQRSPLTTLESCAASWSERLLPGAGVAIAFNTHMPTREQLAGVMASVGLRPLPIALPHRMSESIIRDVAVFRKDG